MLKPANDAQPPSDDEPPSPVDRVYSISATENQPALQDTHPTETITPPPQEKHFEHLRWVIVQSDTFKLFPKFTLILLVGMLLYLIGTTNVWAFFTLSVVLPLILFITDHFFYKDLFDETFVTNTPLIRVKYMTFVFQNLSICLVYWFGDDNAMSHLVTWIVRINILEVLIESIQFKRYILLIPSIMLILPITNASLTTFPTFKVRLDDRYLCVWEEWDPWFIIIYTGWFIAWILKKSQRVTYVLHCFFPLFGPPQLWFSIRTFAGMFLLWFLYLKKLQKIVNTPESVNERAAFSEIYDALFILVFVCCYVISAAMRLWEI